MGLEVATPPQHSKRVEAWVYAVLNPIIESLQRESFLLSKGNLSWRFYSRRCEYIHPVRDYVRVDQRPNYEDFVSDPLNTGFLEKFDAHDHALAEVELNSSRFASGLIQANLFVEKMQESLKEYESIARGNPLYSYDESMQERLPRAVAELLVNRIDVLPEHYGTAKFWEKYRDKFDLSGQEFEPYRQREPFQALVRARDALQQLTDKLLHDLYAHRQLLCRTYDIPAAPIPVNRSVTHSADAFIV
jgi:uncharacterized protein YjiS (DUF1127 family)